MPAINPFIDFLEEEPKATYFSFRNRFGGQGRSPRQESFYGDQFSNLFDEYLGSLGTQARAGFEPTGTFNDFMGRFDFTDWYRRQVPYRIRNQGYEDLVPRSRWLTPGF